MGTLALIGTSLLWGAVHSVLASFPAKEAARRLLGPATDRWYRLAYNVFSVVSLAPVLWLSLVLPDRPVYSIPVPWSYLTLLVQLAAAGALVAGVLQTGALSFMGLRQLVEGGSNEKGLVTGGLYRYVRHPLYAAGILLIWLAPEMTLNRLTLFAALTVYLLIGAAFEERKLHREYGRAYADYAAKTPMFIPLPIPGKDRR